MNESFVSNGKASAELLKSGQLLSISGSDDAGLIIQKPFFAEFVSHGAAVGGCFDLQCVSVYMLGDVQISVPEHKEARQVACQKRVENIECMQSLCQAESSLERGVAVLEMLCERFDKQQVQTIPNDVLAKLVGVLPQSIAEAWQHLSRNPFTAPPAHQPAHAA